MAAENMDHIINNFGAHVSIAGGIFHAPERGERLGCDAIQIFTKNQMQWASPPLKAKDIEKFKENLATHRPGSVITHDSYLINLGSPEEEKLEKSRTAFLDEIQRCDLLGIPYLVFHPGAHTGAGEQFALDSIAESLNWAHAETSEAEVVTLVEITAGQGTNVGYSFEHLKEIIEKVHNQRRIGICIDTCHMFTAGYDIRSRSAYEQTWKEFESVVGLEWLKAFHLNDSKKEFASRVDRHENLGHGYLGLEPFRLLVNDERFEGLPMVLETPGGDKWYRKNLQILRKLAGRKKVAVGLPL